MTSPIYLLPTHFFQKIYLSIDRYLITYYLHLFHIKIMQNINTVYLFMFWQTAIF